MAEELERTAVREREPEQGCYEALYRARREFQERQSAGKVVVKAREREWELSRQGRIRWYLHPQMFKDTVLQDWYVFVQDIRTHSGKHTHQGGLVIYVLEGKGYTVVDGEKVEWEEGDLLLLPLKPGGVEHQHFNAEPGKGCRWLAFIYVPLWDHVGSQLEQKEVSPEWRKGR